MTETLKSQGKITHVRTAMVEILPRVLALAKGFLEAVSYAFSEQEFTLFVEVFQQTTPLQLRELWMLVPVLKLVFLEQIVARGSYFLKDPRDGSHGAGICVRSLRDIGQTTWKDVLEPLMLIDRVLQKDPAGAYGRMDFESRDLYRKRLSNIAEHSDCAELDVAKAGVALAEESATSFLRGSARLLCESLTSVTTSWMREKRFCTRKYASVPPFGQKIQGLLRKHPDEFFLMGIQVLAFTDHGRGGSLPRRDLYDSLTLIFFSMLLLLLPSSQAAVQLMNAWVTALLPPANSSEARFH